MSLREIMGAEHDIRASLLPHHSDFQLRFDAMPTGRHASVVRYPSFFYPGAGE